MAVKIIFGGFGFFIGCAEVVLWKRFNLLVPGK